MALNLKVSSASRCRHLLKTFYSGANGWRDRQEPDGTVTDAGHSSEKRSLPGPLPAVPVPGADTEPSSH
jgi:hypothetical protein